MTSSSKPTLTSLSNRSSKIIGIAAVSTPTRIKNGITRQIASSPITSSKSSSSTPPVNSNSVATRKQRLSGNRVKTRVTVPPIPLALPSSPPPPLPDTTNDLTPRLIISNVISHDFSSDFLTHLNENASRIQSWYRRIQQSSRATVNELIKQHQQNLSSGSLTFKYPRSSTSSNLTSRRLSRPSKKFTDDNIAHSSTTTTTTTTTDDDRCGNNDEATTTEKATVDAPEQESRIDQIKRRREEMAKSVREEILKELEQSRSRNQSSETLVHSDSMDILTKDRGSGGCSSNNSTDTLQNITAPYSNASNDILNQAKDQASSQKVVDHVGADFLVGNNVCVFANASEPILIDSANHFSKEKALYSKQMSDLKSDYEYENEVFESLEFSLLDLEAAINKGPQPNEPQFSLENIKKEEEEEKMLQVNAQVDDDRFDGKSSTSDTIGLEATPTIAAAVEQQFHSEAAVNTPILEAGVKKVAIPKTTAAASKRVKNKRISQIIADTTTTIPETSTVSSTPEDDDDEEEAETSTGLSQSEAVLDDSTNQRIERILGFLRDVEEDDTRKNHTSVATSHQNYPHLHQQQQTNSNNPTPSDLYSTPYSPSSTTAVFDGVKAKIMGQQLELEEKTQTLSLLKKEIKKIKDINKEQSIQFKKDLKSKLNLQRKEYETIIKRHLTFIDKLLSEKDDLSKKCETLTEEVKSMEKQFKEKSRVLEEQHIRDTKQQKELWAATEKVKRDKWIAEKTKLIKDQTIKGLEPEIQRMLAQHKQQMRQLEEKFREDLVKEKNLLLDQNQRQLDLLRDKFVGERQKACEEEREFARQRYQKQLERDELEFQQQKRKLQADFNEQRHHLLESAKGERLQEESNHKRIVEDLRKQIEDANSQKEKALEESRKKHLIELNSLQEKLMIQKEEWQTHYMAKQETEIRNREKLFKEKLIKERDAEIEMIIQRLESETNSNQSDVTRRQRMEMEKLKADMADEIKNLRDQHSMALDKVISIQNNLGHSEEKNRELQKELLQAQHNLQSKDNLIKQQKNSLCRLQVDENTLSVTIRQEFEEQLEQKERAIDAVKEELTTMQSQIEVLQRKHSKEVSQLSAEKEKALQAVESQVMKTINIKDEIIHSMKKQIEELGIKNISLERLIDKQRRELLQL